MPRLTRYDGYVDCLQGVPFTKDGECDGRVHIHGYHWPASADGPMGGDLHVEPCDKCGFVEWSAEEVQEMLQELEQ